MVALDPEPLEVRKELHAAKATRGVLRSIRQEEDFHGARLTADLLAPTVELG